MSNTDRINSVLDLARADRLLTPAEVARVFSVHTRTVTRWANEGVIDPVWTPGGHRRYRASDVLALLNRN